MFVHFHKTAAGHCYRDFGKKWLRKHWLNKRTLSTFLLVHECTNTAAAALAVERINPPTSLPHAFELKRATHLINRITFQ